MNTRRRISIRHHFIEKQWNAEDLATQTDMRADGLALFSIKFHAHASTAHHPGRRTHVRREPGVVVNIGEDYFWRRSDQHAPLFVPPSHWLSPRLLPT